MSYSYGRLRSHLREGNTIFAHPNVAAEVCFDVRGQNTLVMMEVYSSLLPNMRLSVDLLARSKATVILLWVRQVVRAVWMRVYRLRIWGLRERGVM